MEIPQIKLIVIDILQKYPEARNSDDLLYVMVCKRLGFDIAHTSFERMMLMRGKIGMPKYGSVSRARRLVQEKCENLRADDSVQEARFGEFKAVRECVINEKE